MPGKRVSLNVAELIYFNHNEGKSAGELSKMFGLTRQTIYNIIKRAENEGRLHSESSNGRPKKLSDRAERRLIKKIYENPQYSTRELAIEINNECDINVSHETVRQTLLRHKYSSRVARKKPLLSGQNIAKRLSFATEHIVHPDDFWDDVIFCDETKIMLYYNEGPNRVWRQPLTALDARNIIPTVKFGKLSVMVWGCISSKGVGDLVLIDGHMDAAQYLKIMQTNLINSANKFGFNGENANDKPKFKFYQDNDPKHKALIVKTWLIYNCKKVLVTPAQSPDINPIENLWVHLKKKVAKRHPTNKRDLMKFILEEWTDIPNNYDLKKLIYSMRNRLKSVIDAKGRHTKY